jgi:hypothetical protein
MNNHQILINNIESEDWKLAKIGAIQDNLKIGAWVANSTKKYSGSVKYIVTSILISGGKCNVEFFQFQLLV